MTRTEFKRLPAKLVSLALLLAKRPFEFRDRILGQLDSHLEFLWNRPVCYETTEWHDAILGIEKCIDLGFRVALEEVAYAEMTEHVRRQTDEIRARAPFSLVYGADFVLASLCYGICRVLKPATIVETGVAYGVTSAFILKALELNGHGVLHSVDLPPLEKDAGRYVGILVPQRLRRRWRLYRGASKTVLPHLLREDDQIDMFIHDSLHTYSNMAYEFRIVSRHLAPNAVVVADDVEGNRAFLDWVKTAQPAYWTVIREAEKKSLCGIAVFRGSESSAEGRK